MIPCTKCGHRNRDGNRFCTACGAKLEEAHRALAQLTPVVPDRPSASFLLSEAPASVGRGAFNDVVVDDEHVSQQHARLFYQDEVFWVEDLRSTNGTYVNGTRIDAPTRLTAGDLLKVGATILRFDLLGPR